MQSIACFSLSHNHHDLLRLTFSFFPSRDLLALISLCLLALKMIKADLNRLGASGALRYLVGAVTGAGGGTGGDADSTGNGGCCCACCGGGGIMFICMGGMFMGMPKFIMPKLLMVAVYWQCCLLIK